MWEVLESSLSIDINTGRCIQLTSPKSDETRALDLIVRENS